MISYVVCYQTRVDFILKDFQHLIRVEGIDLKVSEID